MKDLRLILPLLCLVFASCDTRPEHDRPKADMPEVRLEEMAMVWSRDIAKGEKIENRDIYDSQRPSEEYVKKNGVPATRRGDFVGKVLKRDVKKDQYVQDGDMAGQ